MLFTSLEEIYYVCILENTIRWDDLIVFLVLLYTYVMDFERIFLTEVISIKVQARDGANRPDTPFVELRMRANAFKLFCSFTIIQPLYFDPKKKHKAS